MPDPNALERGQTPDQDTVLVVKSFQLGNFVVGRRVETDKDTDTITEPPTEEVETSSAPARQDANAGTPYIRFLIQRPVTYAGEAGFFESEEVQGLLDRAEAEDDFSIDAVPHVTITGRRFARQAMGSRSNSTTHKVISECQELVASDKFPERYDGRVSGADLFGCRVGLKIDQPPLVDKLTRDAKQIYGHFGLQYQEGDFDLHISLLKTTDPDRAQEVIAELNQILSADGPDSPADVAVGGLTLLRNTRS
jgi:hypothetical protein